MNDIPKKDPYISLAYHINNNNNSNNKKNFLQQHLVSARKKKFEVVLKRKCG